MAESRLNPREQARLEEQKKNQKIRNRYILVGAVILLMIVLVVFVNSRLFTDGLPALKVGDVKYTVADVNYEYRKAYMQFSQNYGEYLSIFFNTDTPLSEQECSIDPDCATWDDYFKKSAESNLAQSTAIYKAALDAGCALTEEEQHDLDETMSTYAMYSTYYGYPNVNGYLAAMFGAGNNEETVRRNMTRELICDHYLNEIRSSYSFTDAEKDAYYSEHADTLDKVDFLYSYISGDDAEAKIAQLTEKITDVDEEGFRAAVKEITGEEAVDTAYSVSSFLSQYGEAVTKDELAAGKTFTLTNDAGSYAVYITGLDDNQYNTVSVRHILIKAEDADGDGEYSDSELETAYNAIKAIEDEWKAGAATEESFAALATEHTQDDGSKENGGLYEDIYKGQMVEEFDEFCFAGHKKGDTAIVKGSSSAYTGYHLIYFVGADGELYSRVMAGEQLLSDAYNTALAEITSGAESTRAIMWRYVMKG